MEETILQSDYEKILSFNPQLDDMTLEDLLVLKQSLPQSPFEENAELKKSIHYTKHARKRIKQRIGIKNERCIQKLVEDAFYIGFGCNSDKKVYTKAIGHYSHDGNHIYMRVHRGFIFIFTYFRLLITVIPVYGYRRRGMERNNRKLNKANK